MFEKAGEGESAPCATSRGGEVTMAAASPGSLLRAGLTQACTQNRMLLSQGGGVGAGMLWLREEKARRADL